MVRKAYESVGEGIIEDAFWRRIGELMNDGLERFDKREGKKRAE